MRTAACLFLTALTAGAAFGADTKARAASPAPAATKAKVSLKIKWSTASEVDNYGFFVMRGDTKDGPFKQLNEKALAGAGTVDTPSKYEFEDTDVVAGRTYFYYLDSISVQGVREKFSPVASRVCCNQPGTAKLEEPGAHAPAPDPSPTPAPPAAP